MFEYFLIDSLTMKQLTAFFVILALTIGENFLNKTNNYLISNNPINN